MTQEITHDSGLPPPIKDVAFPMILILELSIKGVDLRRAGMRPLLDAARIDAGYCLDAPDELPAGGCASETADLDDGDPPYGFAVQLTVQRVQQQEKQL